MGNLGVIPARGGSKGIKNKNLINIGNHTLVERALFTALGCKLLDRIIVSSDSVEIISLANEHGEYAPFVRPTELATDKAGSLGVIQHALEWAEKEDKTKYEYIVLLEPPAPFRLPKHIEEALEIASRGDATSVMSVVEVGDYHPIRMKKMDDNGALRGYVTDEPEGLRRQDQESAYIRNCAVCVFPRATIMSGQLWGDAPYGYMMDHSLYGINIDDAIDVLTANAYYEEMIREDTLKLIEFIPDGS